jgi:prophage regulatory protein
MPKKLLRMPEVEQRTGLSRSAVYLKMKAKQFPASVQVGPQITAWLESDVDAWIDAQVCASRGTMTSVASR